MGHYFLDILYVLFGYQVINSIMGVGLCTLLLAVVGVPGAGLSVRTQLPALLFSFTI